MLKNRHDNKIWVTHFLNSTGKQKAHCLLVTWTKTYWNKSYNKFYNNVQVQFKAHNFTQTIRKPTKKMCKYRARFHYCTSHYSNWFWSTLSVMAKSTSFFHTTSPAFYFKPSFKISTITRITKINKLSQSQSKCEISNILDWSFDFSYMVS